MVQNPPRDGYSSLVQGIGNCDHRGGERRRKAVPFGWSFRGHVIVVGEFGVNGQQIVVGPAHLKLAAKERPDGRRMEMAGSSGLLIHDSDTPETEPITQFHIFPSVRAENGIEWFVAQNRSADRDVRGIKTRERLVGSRGHMVEAELVASDGSSVGTSMMAWIATPHFYINGMLIVLYVGDSSETIGLLEDALGPQFAGG